MSDNRVNELIGVINSFFRRQNIANELLITSDRFIYRCGFIAHSKNYSNLRFELVVDEFAMQSYVTLPDKFEGHEDAIAKYISRINPEFKLGRFQFNVKSGYIAFHLGQRSDIVRKDMDSKILMDQVYYPLTIMTRFADGFYELAHDSVSPEEVAIKYLNANRTSPDNEHTDK